MLEPAYKMTHITEKVYKVQGDLRNLQGIIESLASIGEWKTTYPAEDKIHHGCGWMADTDAYPTMSEDSTILYETLVRLGYRVYVKYVKDKHSTDLEGRSHQGIGRDLHCLINFEIHWS